MGATEAKAESAEQRLEELCENQVPCGIIILSRDSEQQKFDSVDGFKKYPEGYEFSRQERSGLTDKPWSHYLFLYVKPRDTIFKFYIRKG